MNSFLELFEPELNIWPEDQTGTIEDRTSRLLTKSHSRRIILNFNKR